MGWVWTNDDSVDVPSAAGDVTEFRSSSNPSGDGATRKVVRSQCRTEEVEPGKFIRKCEKTEEVFKDCIGRPSEMVQFFKECTEEDVTEQMVKGPFPLESAEREPFTFPGVRSDIESIERHFSGSIYNIFHGMNEFFNSVGHIFDDNGPSPHNKRGIPIKSHPPREAFTEKKPNGDDNLFGKATDV